MRPGAPPVGGDPAWPGVVSVGGLTTPRPAVSGHLRLGHRWPACCRRFDKQLCVEDSATGWVESLGGASSRRCEVEPLLAEQVGPHLRVFEIDLRNGEISV